MNYDLLVEKNTKRNKKYLNGFRKWLDDKKLSDRTIKRHISNIDLYINIYLAYYEITLAEEGAFGVDRFLSDWYIRKCLDSSKSGIRSTAASIKKFYEYMKDLGLVKASDYEWLVNTLKKNMNKYINNYIKYESQFIDEWF